MKRFLIISVILLTAFVFIASCSNDYSDSGSSGSGGGGDGASFAPAVSDSGVSGGSTTSAGAAPDAPNYTEQDFANLPILTPSEAAGRRLIYTLTLNLQTTEFMHGVRTLLDAVEDSGGYLMSAIIEGRDMRSPEVERMGDYEFRIPTVRLSDILIVVENNYNITRLQQSAEDVTPRYNRSGMRLEDLLEQERRLIDALSGELEAAEERLSMERMLSDVQNQISELFTYQSSVDDSVMYAKVIVHLREVIFVEEEPVEVEADPTFGERLGNRVSRSASAFVRFCQGVLMFIIAIAPALVVIAILAIPALLIVRRVMKRRKVESAQPNQAVSPQASPAGNDEQKEPAQNADD